MDYKYYKLTQDQLQSRPNIILISDRGMKYRQDVTKPFSLPKLIKNEYKMEQQQDLSSRAQLSLNGIKQKKELIEEFKQQVQIDNPFLEKQLNKFTDKILKREKPTVQINQKLEKLYDQLEKQEELLAKRNIKYRQKLFNRSMDTSIMQEEELQDRIAAIASIEAKINKMHQKYNYSIMKREETMDLLQVNKKKYIQQRNIEMEGNVNKVNLNVIQDYNTPYQERFVQRLKDYQRIKYEKHWKKQPPPLKQ
ncbi:hypothetical protein pb186bvf_006568 [Paramecium bursaria]